MSLAIGPDIFLRKHALHHDKPVRCRVSDCTKSFATKTIMERHVASLHRSVSSKPLNFCHVQQCQYAEGGSKNGFARKDDLRRHEKVHR